MLETGSRDAAFALLGRGALVKNRNHHKVLKREWTRLANYFDIEALPPHMTGQIVDGELCTSPRPAPAHARTASSLGAFVNAAFDLGLLGPGGWRIMDKPELHLQESSAQ